MSRKIKVAIVITHPIQYYASMFASLAAQPEIDLMVLYTQGIGYDNQKDTGFGQQVKWNIPLLSGYPFRFLNNISFRPSNNSFFGVINTNLHSELKSFAPDFVVCYGYSYWSHLFLILFPRGNKVILRGDSTLLNFRNSIRDKFKTFVLKRVFAKLFAAFYVGHENLAYLNLFAPQLKKHYVPHTIDNAEFRSRAKDVNEIKLRDYFEISKYKRVFVFAGKLVAIKNVGLLCDVISETFPDILLLIVGDGEQAEELKMKNTAFNNIKFAGFVNQSEISTYLSVADAVVLASTSETWGFVINEAMAWGKPCIVSDKVGSKGDLVQNGKTGFIFRSGDKSSLVAAIHDMLKALDQGEINNTVISHAMQYDNSIQVEKMLVFFKENYG